MSDLVEYKPGTTFPGVIGRTVSESSPAWPQPVRAKEGAPNVIFFILDAHVIAPDKPFFLYHAPGCAHAPHQVAPEWIEKFKGKFDMGWDEYREVVFARQKELGVFPAGAELSPRDPDVPEWDTLSDEQKTLYARFMEVYAGFLEHCDQQFGRILQTLEDIGELDNTLIMILPDNGASSEGGVNGAFNEMSSFNYYWETMEDILPRIDELGGPSSYNHYPWGWSWAGNTPFRRWKKEVYRGGCTDDLVIHWPKGIEAKRENRTQYAHAIDMVPTVLEVLGISPPEQIRGVDQSPIEGVSFAHTFEDAVAPSEHHTQYFEMFASRAIDHDGWRAVCGFPGPSYTEGAEGRHLGDEITPELLDDLDANGWELYNLTEDPTESHNLAGEHPEKLAEMIARWYVEAGKYKVMPLDGTLFQRLVAERPQVALPRDQYTFYPDLTPVHVSVAPMVYNRPHSITAEVEIPAGGAEGVLLAQGGVAGGFVFYVKDEKLHYLHNYLGLEEYKVTSTVDVPEGAATLRYEFEPTGEPDPRHGRGTPGRAQLYINDELVGNAEFPTTVPLTFGIEGLSCGYDFGEVVTHEYHAPFRFTGTIKQVVTDISGELIEDDEAKVRMLMSQQ